MDSKGRLTGRLIAAARALTGVSQRTRDRFRDFAGDVASLGIKRRRLDS